MTNAQSKNSIQSWNGPTNTIPALRGPDVERDARAGDGDDDLGYELLDFPDPITHGMGVNFVLNDAPELATYDKITDTAYRRVLQAWRQHVEDPGNEPYVVASDAHELFDFANDDYPADLCLRSKGWKVGTKGLGTTTKNQRYEYSVQLVRKDPESGELKPKKPLPVNFQTWIKPQEHGLEYKSGDELELPYGAGTWFSTQTTYAEPLEAINRTCLVLNVALDALDQDRPDWPAINRDSMKIWKGEVHHRIDRELMSAACETLAEARRLIDYGGGAEMEQHSKRQERGRVEEYVRANRWDLLGFVQPEGLDLAVKCYRSSNWHAYRDNTYKNPKVEAFIGGKSDSQQALPHVREWTALRGVLRQLATGVTVRSGVAMSDLIQDDYYQGWEHDLVDVPIPMGWRTKLQEANDERERQIYRTTMSALSRAKWDILWTIAQYEGATYDQLQDVTGLSRDYIREIVREFDDADVLERLTWPRVIVYHNEELRVNAIEALQDVHPDEGITTIKQRADERRETRQRERRERENDDPDVDAGGDQDDDTLRSSSDDELVDEADDVDVSPSPLKPGDWYQFNDLDVLSPEELRNALERDYIDESDVAVRVDRYDWLKPTE